ncbi:glycosyltransferase family 4 protein [Mycolicibacterium baixiangningiae]|uniref:glycosyltransferase family 4 protein n=1 Tax=Mycolicibacterium baixiangningiae TaxID=2761578 RepID=UPI0018D014AF|nr:glycosyltransferase family 4 protein [Mycolicibacterium baixiangningiae]
MNVAVTHLIVGPSGHGVTRFGVELAQAMRDNGFDAPAWRTPEPPPSGGVHLQFTDRLFGSTPEQAADAVGVLVCDIRQRGGRVTATLHDLPQASDGTHHDQRRAAYAEVAALVDGVVVSSEHERALLAEGGVRPRRVAVVPLPVEAATAEPPCHQGPPTVGVFGFLYPGKGHAEVIAALAGAAPDVEILALGAPSAGHTDLVSELADDCARTGRRFRVTGHLGDADVPRALRSVTVPVAPHRHVSASGSLNSWISAGRRPLAPANRYTREFDLRNPGAVLLYPDTAAGLREALADALADPAMTWLPPGTTCTPTPAAAARQYADLLQRWHR